MRRETFVVKYIMKTKTKILIVSVDFPPHTDGVSTVAHELASRMSRAGEQIIVIGPQAKGAKEYDSLQKFKVIRTPWYEFGYLRLLPILFVMPWVILRYRISIVIPMNIAYGGVIAYLFSRILGFKYAMWAYGYEFGKFEKNKFMHNLYLKIYNNAMFVAAITEFVKARLIKFGVIEEKITLIKPGTDHQKYYPIKIADDFKEKYNLSGKKVVLSVGRLVERKGFDMVIRAMPEIIRVHPDVVYVLVGGGPFRQSLENLANVLSIEKYIRFAGRVPDEELFKFYNLCDIFVMPSRTLEDRGDIEGFGIVYLEANACEKPVIGGKSGGVTEAIEDGITGLLVDPFNKDEIAQVIIKLLSDRELAQRLGKNGRKRVVEELNWQRAVELFQENLGIGHIK